MKNLSKIAVTVATALTCSFAFAQTYGGDDQARRERNREEEIAKYRAGDVSRDTGPASSRSDRASLRERGHRVAAKTRSKTHQVAAKTRSKTHQIASSTRNFTHRQAERARDFGARTNERFPAPAGRLPAKAQEHSAP